jgi:ferredoxin
VRIPPGTQLPPAQRTARYLSHRHGAQGRGRRNHNLGGDEGDLNGSPPADIRTEVFGARGSINPGISASTTRPPHEPAGSPGTGPLVTFARTGLSVHFGTGGRTILELAETCDVPTRWSCRAGVCHICITPLLSGTINYVQAPLETPGPQNVLICSAEPTTDIVFDI